MEKEEFLRILPKLIREDDEVKGAIITALSGIVATKEDIKTVIEESNRRFETMQTQMDRRFETMQTQMDRRFEELIKLMNKGFEDARKDRENLKVFIATVSSRGGEYLEDAILNLLNDQLIKESINKSKITREPLIDKDGKIYYKDYSTNIDVLIQDSKLILIEVKFHADNRDIADLLRKGQLFKAQFRKNYNELVIVCSEISKTNFEQAIKHGVRIIAGKIIQI
jgi:hypothetical protein